jgi:RND superfamily putative drug exporter
MPTPPESVLARLARFTVRRRRLVLVTWIVVLVLAVVGGPKIAGDWSVDYSTPRSDSKAVADTIATKFPGANYDKLLFTWSAAGGASSAAAEAHVRDVIAKLHTVPTIGTIGVDQAEISRDGRIGLLTVPLHGRPANIAADHGPEILKIADAASTDAVKVRLGGIVMTEAERGSVSSEGVGLTVALLILLATFGTIIAAGLPIAVALFGIGSGAALVGGIAALVATPDWAESVAAMVGIGVGIDYALLILTRHRAALAAGASVEDSLAGALSTAGRSVVVAGGTVVISLLGLLLMGLPYLQGVALSASVSVLVVMLASLTLLPALLGFAGRKVDAFAIRLPGGKGRADRRAVARAEHHPGLAADLSPRFASWSRMVQRRPWIATIVGLLLIALIASPVTGVRLGFPGMANDPVGSQSREANALLIEGFGPGSANPMYVAATVDGKTDAAKVDALRAAIAKNPRVALARPAVYSPDGTTALIEVQSRFSAETDATDHLLRELRDDVVPAAGLPAKVGGWTAETHDQARATESRLPLLFLGVAGLSALLLLAAFRSVLIPVKAAAMNLLSIAAAYGIVVLVAHGGTIGQLVGVSGEVPIPPFIPVLMFAVLFGLSMDYEVFLLGRMRELWLERGDASRAVTDGVASTARVITAAAAIMIAVFGAFGLSDQIFLKLIGIGMASAILIDATIIRLLLVPALMELMGKHAWWLPRWLDRLVPEARIEGEAVATAPTVAPAGSTSAQQPARVGS